METTNTQRFGQWGEDEAARYLSRRGLKVMDRHYVQKWGELDLICRDRDTWVFVEVKTRSSHFEPSAVESITPQKRRRLIRAALSYMKWKRLQGQSMRFDVLLIEADDIEWIQDAFEVPSYYTF